MCAHAHITIAAPTTKNMSTTTTAPAKRYKVFRVYRNSARRVTIDKGLTLDEAQRLVRSFPSTDRSMVCYTQQ
jgi:hypothetical protein